jgi:hypothetical protein
MVFSNATLSILVLASLSLAILVVVLLLPGAMRDRARRPRSGALAEKRPDVVIEDHAKAIRRLEAAVRKLALAERRLGELTEEAVRHVGVVRFDAFEEMGGRLSFSAALLDSRGDGVVITSINGRQETRCYAKQVRGGTSIHHLSDEERQAIREALEGGRPGRVAEAAR